MSTQKQRDANRRNAQFSTGPTSDPGKSTSSLNALKHGFCADDATLYDDPETSQHIETRILSYFNHYQPVTPLEEATLREIAVCEIRLDRLVRAETGLLNFYRQLAFQHHTFNDPAGNVYHKFDSSTHRPGDERHVANMLLGVAWRDAGPEIDRMSRYESRLRVRYEKALKRLDSLLASRPAPEPPKPQPDPDPPPTPKPPQPEIALLPNEPNFDLTPAEATTATPATPPAINPVNKEVL